jgi:hypothetical protein
MHLTPILGNGHLKVDFSTVLGITLCEIIFTSIIERKENRIYIHNETERELS